MVRCMGIDPAIASIGWGVIDDNEAVDYGVISTPANKGIYERLAMIRDDVTELCASFLPDVVALEMPFFGRENTNATKVLRALGVIELALGDGGIGNPIYLHQSQVKSAVSQYGASKGDVQDAVMVIFGLDKRPTPDDAADGLAIAYAAMIGMSSEIK